MNTSIKYAALAAVVGIVSMVPAVQAVARSAADHTMATFAARFFDSSAMFTGCF